MLPSSLPGKAHVFTGGVAAMSVPSLQRLVGLEIVSDDAAKGLLVVRGPPDITIAPPGM